MGPIILEDTQFREAIQLSMQGSAFRSVPLSYQEVRICSFHQSLDAMIGFENVPPRLRVEPVIGADWTWPNDPRRAQMQREAGAARDAAE